MPGCSENFVTIVTTVTDGCIDSSFYIFSAKKIEKTISFKKIAIKKYICDGEGVDGAITLHYHFQKLI